MDWEVATLTAAPAAYNQVPTYHLETKGFWLSSNFVSALLKRGDVNVIAVDYAISAFGYTAAYNSIASQVSSFLLRNGINPANTMVIGQSMGAQVAGVLYRYGFKPNSIIGK